MKLQEGWLDVIQPIDRSSHEIYQSRGQRHKQSCDILQCRYIDSCTQVHTQGSKTKLQAILEWRAGKTGWRIIWSQKGSWNQPITRQSQSSTTYQGQNDFSGKCKCHTGSMPSSQRSLKSTMMTRKMDIKQRAGDKECCQTCRRICYTLTYFSFP